VIYALAAAGNSTFLLSTHLQARAIAAHATSNDQKFIGSGIIPKNSWGGPWVPGTAATAVKTYHYRIIASIVIVEGIREVVVNGAFRFKLPQLTH